MHLFFILLTFIINQNESNLIYINQGIEQNKTSIHIWIKGSDFIINNDSDLLTVGFTFGNNSSLYIESNKKINTKDLMIFIIPYKEGDISPKFFKIDIKSSKSHIKSKPSLRRIYIKLPKNYRYKLTFNNSIGHTR